jgi:hypothetical protein
MENKIELSLLEYLYSVYPVGLPYLQTRFKGVIKANEILLSKLNNLENNSDWKPTIEELAKKFPGTLLDRGFIQFPSYLASIDRQKSTSERFIFVSRLHLCISLLCPYYTVFFEDEYRFDKHFEFSITLPHRIFYSKRKPDSSELEKTIEEVQKIVAKYFPQYEFVSHQILFRHKIPGVIPYREDPNTQENSYTFYRLLFEGSLYEDYLQIME